MKVVEKIRKDGFISMWSERRVTMNGKTILKQVMAVLLSTIFVMALSTFAYAGTKTVKATKMQLSMEKIEIGYHLSVKLAPFNVSNSLCTFKTSGKCVKVTMVSYSLPNDISITVQTNDNENNIKMNEKKTKEYKTNFFTLKKMVF
mgnify:CR=1 FL=1